MLCISSSKPSEDAAPFVLLRRGECVVLDTRPKSARERHPSLRCPVCRKILGAFDTPRDKNCALVYDASDPRMSSLPHRFLRACPRCHRTVGVAVLEDRTEELFRQTDAQRAV